MRMREIMRAPTTLVERDTRENPKFKAWFKNSKVVDNRGNPLTVFHGTGAAFNAFSPDVEPTNYEADRGVFHFTDNEATAQAYSELGGPFGDIENENPRVIAAYLSLQNPMIHDARIGYSAIEEWDNENIGEWAKERGHDGVIIRPGDNSSESLYVAFRPNQIKSATDNRGNYDPDHDDISENINENAELATLVKNPSTSQLKNLLQKYHPYGLRGVLADNTVWVWNAYDTTHHYVALKLGLDKPAEFMIRANEYGTEVNDHTRDGALGQNERFVRMVMRLDNPYWIGKHTPEALRGE
jgi:hypothetical protein